MIVGPARALGSETNIGTANGHVCFTPRADMCDALANVRFGPKADIHRHHIVDIVDALSLIFFVPTLAFKFLVFPECWIVGRPLTKWRRY